MRPFPIILCVVLAAVSFSCAPDDPRGELEKTRAETLKKFQAITYRRIGGPAKVDDLLAISSDGQVQAKSRMYGEAKATLNEMQQLQLSTLFENWDQIKPEYPSPKPSGKPAIEEIQYGEKKVLVADDAENVPEELSRVRARLSVMLSDSLK